MIERDRTVHAAGGVGHSAGSDQGDDREAADSDPLDGAGDGQGSRHRRQIWQVHGLKPHQVRTFKLSNDPAFEEKLVDIVGLYLDPPDKALVLSVDD
jgi:hypothetical protein